MILHTKDAGAVQKKEFFEFYNIAATHLKKCFPHLKIGGPALAGKLEWAEEFLAQLKAPLDFFSWHVYSSNTQKIETKLKRVRGLLDKYGFVNTESILNEWNYVRSFRGDDWLYSLRMEKSLKGAAFIGAVMCMCQYLPLDMLMYYDARPCGMNGMFNTDFVCDCLKGYYPFKMFNELYKMEKCSPVISDNPNVYACAASNGEKAAIMISHFDDTDTELDDNIKIDVNGFANEKVLVKYYLLDQSHDMTVVKEEIFTSARYFPMLRLPLHASCLITIEKA